MGFDARSAPSVDVRDVPAPAEQNEPPPCVGYSSGWSGSAASALRSVRNCARVSGSVISGDTRSVRAAPPTSSDPPLNNAGACPGTRRA